MPGKSPETNSMRVANDLEIQIGAYVDKYRSCSTDAWRQIYPAGYVLDGILSLTSTHAPFSFLNKMFFHGNFLVNAEDDTADSPGFSRRSIRGTLLIMVSTICALMFTRSAEFNGQVLGASIGRSSSLQAFEVRRYNSTIHF